MLSGPKKSPVRYDITGGHHGHEGKKLDSFTEEGALKVKYNFECLTLYFI